MWRNARREKEAVALREPRLRQEVSTRTVMGTRSSDGTAGEFGGGRNELRERRRACVQKEMRGKQRCDLVVLLRGQNQARVIYMYTTRDETRMKLRLRCSTA